MWLWRKLQCMTHILGFSVIWSVSVDFLIHVECDYMYLSRVIRRGKWILCVNRLMGDWMLQVNKCWLWCFVMQMIGFWMSLIFLFWSLFYFYHYVLFNGTWLFVMVKMILNNAINTAVCFVNWYIYIYLIFINTMTKVWINISVLLNFVFINAISMCMILQSCLLQTESDNIIRMS